MNRKLEKAAGMAAFFIVIHYSIKCEFCLLYFD